MKRHLTVPWVRTVFFTPGLILLLCGETARSGRVSPCTETASAALAPASPLFNRTVHYPTREALGHLKHLVRQKMRDTPDRPIIMLLDGAIGAGKSTLAKRLTNQDPRIAWIERDRLDNMRDHWSVIHEAVHERLLLPGIRLIIIDAMGCSRLYSTEFPIDLRVLVTAAMEDRINNIHDRSGFSYEYFTPTPHMRMITQVDYEQDYLLQGIFDLIIRNGRTDHLPMQEPFSLLEEADTDFTAVLKSQA